MRALSVAALALGGTFALRPAPPRSPSPTATLGWIAGCWRQTTPGQVVDEQWMPPRAGMMIGMSRTVRGDSVVREFEHLRIFDRQGAAVYHAEPSGQTPADFTAAAVSDSLVVFANPAHDFPQRIIYRRRGPDSLVARVEGTIRGQSRVEDYPYKRVPCT